MGEKTDFGQLIKTLSNDAEKALWFNYTVKGQNWISMAYCHLSSFLVIIICINAWKEVGCALTSKNINLTNYCDFIWDDMIWKCQIWDLL